MTYDSRLTKSLSLLFISWFIFLCFLHYLSQRPLWLDENYIFSSMKALSPLKIFGPLSRAQTFPRLYLFLIKISSNIFSFNVLALRFFPLVSMLFAFFVWRKIYSLQFQDKRQYLLLLFSFCGVYRFSYYAAELKHYSMDVLVIGIFCLYFIWQKKYFENQLSRLFVLVTLLLPFTLPVSYSGFFVFWIAAYNLLFSIKKNNKFLFLIIAYILLSGAILFFIFITDIRHTLKVNALFDYWHDYFLCTKSFYCFIKSFGEGLRRLSVWWFGANHFLMRAGSFIIPIFLFSLFGYGIKAIKKDRFQLQRLDSIALVVFCELFILGILYKYPFTGERITLFFAPLVIYLIVKGINCFKRKKFIYLSLVAIYCIFLLLCNINALLMHLRLYS